MEQSKKRIYFKNLDGLRFLCFLSVFFFHSFHTENEAIKESWIYHFVAVDLFGNGNLGVNFFFVLSGFLITYLLIQEKQMNGQIDLKKFWIRRILRIWPLFYFCVFFGFVIFPQLKLLFGQTPNETANWLYYLTFLNNFDLIANGLPDSSVLGVLWSVAIEEQFYLVWPIILYFFPIKKYWIPFTILIAISLGFRSINTDALLHEHHTLSCIGDMTIGAIGAWAVIMYPKFLERIVALKRREILIIYLLFIVVFFFRDELLYQYELIRVVERTLIAIIILFIILEQNYAKASLFKMSKLKLISNLGIITYGLYCLHFIGILVAINLTKLIKFNTELWQVMILETLLALSITIVISKISYHVFEKPFLKLKDKFSYITK